MKATPSSSISSRWRLVKHVIVAALRLRRRLACRSRRSNLEKIMESVASHFPDLELRSMTKADEVVVHRLSGQSYSLKGFPVECSGQEMEILKKLDHPNLVKCYDVVVDGGVSYLLLEPLDEEHGYGSPSVTSESELISLARQLLSALSYLHGNGISHGDIKSSNVFVNHAAHAQAKLLYSGKGKTLSRSSQIGYDYDLSWDIWSLGRCILEFSRAFNTDFQFNPSSSSSSSHRAFNTDFQFNPSSSSSSSHREAMVWNLSIEMELMSLLLECARSTDQLVHHPFFYQHQQKNLSRHKEEFMNTVNNIPRISLEDRDRACDLQSPKDLIQGVSHVVLKGCIDYCKLFLPDRTFSKDNLVRMWIAEGCIEQKHTKKRMEDVGNLYFDTLVQKEVIVPWKLSRTHGQMYKTNKSQVMLDERHCLQINAMRMNENMKENMNEICGEVLHLTWKCESFDRTFSDAMKKFVGLHTLVLRGYYWVIRGQLPGEIFLGLRQLRTLDVSHTALEEVPCSIGKAEKLRYLNLSGNPIKELPESVDCLHLLQTLILKDCTELCALPRGFGKLGDLRHLDFGILSKLQSMPRGMRNLVNIQTLQGFIVGVKSDGRGVGELEKLNEIRGTFCITHLEKVSNAEEAKEAALSDKKYIDKLVLIWIYGVGDDIVEDTSEILESLQPHIDLKELDLASYRGSKLPSWISNPAYSNLSRIHMCKCKNCDVLPSIGELPSLKTLYISGMENLRNINTLFCRNGEGVVLSAFPRLEELRINQMPALEGWTGVEEGDFPCLRHVSIVYCPKLCLLPSLGSLELLEISWCTQLKSLPEGLLLGSVKCLKISCCPGIDEIYLRMRSKIREIWIDYKKIYLD